MDRKGSAGRGGKGHAAGVRGAPQPARMLRPIEPRPLREIQREIEAYRAKFDGSSGNWPERVPTRRARDQRHPYATQEINATSAREGAGLTSAAAA